MDKIRMQKLAGILTESQYREQKNTIQAEEALKKTIKEAVASILEKKKKTEEEPVDDMPLDLEEPGTEDNFDAPEMNFPEEGGEDVSSAIDGAMNAIETSATDLSAEDKATLLRLQGNVQAFYNKKKTKAAVAAASSGGQGRDISF
jgi:hypothetical protein